MSDTVIGICGIGLAVVIAGVGYWYFAVHLGGDR